MGKTMMKININSVLSLIRQARTSIDEKDYIAAEYHLICLKNAIEDKRRKRDSDRLLCE